MRTTLQLDDDVYEIAKSLAESRQIPLGKALSELARRGLEPKPREALGDGFPTFDVRPGAAPLTPAMVKQALEEG